MVQSQRMVFQPRLVAHQPLRAIYNDIKPFRPRLTVFIDASPEKLDISPRHEDFPEANLGRGGEGRALPCVFPGVEVRAPRHGMVPVTIVEKCSTQASLLGMARIQLLAVYGYSWPFCSCLLMCDLRTLAPPSTT